MTLWYQNVVRLKTPNGYDVFYPKNEQFPSQIHNIIIYAGNGHTGPLGQTLLSLGFNLTEQSKPTSRIIESCTNMTGIHQPLFK